MPRFLRCGCGCGAQNSDPDCARLASSLVRFGARRVFLFGGSLYLAAGRCSRSGWLPRFPPTDSAAAARVPTRIRRRFSLGRGRGLGSVDGTHTHTCRRPPRHHRTMDATWEARLTPSTGGGAADVGASGRQAAVQLARRSVDLAAS